MNNHEVLKMLLEDLRLQMSAVNTSPLLPGAVKLAVNTTFQIMEILISEHRENGEI